MELEELQLEIESLKNQVRELSSEIKLLDSKPLLVNWPFATLLIKRLEVLSKGNSKYGVRSEDGYYVGVGDSAVNIITSGRVIDNINSVAVDWNPNANDTYALGSATYKWSDIRTILINGSTPLAGTKVYYVADTSGGAVTRKLTFTDGILTSET